MSPNTTMFLDLKTSPDRKTPIKPLKLAHHQAGFLMPLAIFIVVIMGFFIATLARTTTQTSLSVTQEGITLQTFYAAETGAQLAMTSLFYNTGAVLNRTGVDSSCSGMNLTPTFGVTGLNNCSARVSCVTDNTTAPGSSFYTITSVGQCGSGDIRSTRTVQVSARMD